MKLDNISADYHMPLEDTTRKSVNFILQVERISTKSLETAKGPGLSASNHFMKDV